MKRPAATKRSGAKPRAEKPRAEKPRAAKPSAEKPRAVKFRAVKFRAEKPRAVKFRAEKRDAAIVAAPVLADAVPPSSPPSPPSLPIASDWRAELRAEVDATGPDFARYLASLSASAWEHADSPELAGLERWGTELAARNRRAGIGALVRVAQYGLPIALERGGAGLDGMGFHAADASADGAPVETQIARAAAWLDVPDAAHRAMVAAANDPGRQLQIWDDDLIPNDDRAHWWYLDVGQCCGYAITRSGGLPNGNSYYQWPPEVCVGRGLVVAVRGLRCRGAKIGEILAEVRAALVA
jgi:hypothetical protein